jgi:N-acetylglutamate synthase-like GNAT family acetyltransferase
MADFTLRPATEDDFPLIKDLIHRVGINPMSLDWRRFVIAADESGKMLGCGQLKPHGRHVIELASIAVEPTYQNQGIARVIIEHLISHGPRPLYLTCRSRLGSFYEKWGFRSIEPDEMPPYFRRLSRLVNVISSFMNEKMLVMRLM